ncbi:MAG: hypothetical protein DMG07_04785 [Acidobacteria bacterium]|nr:MAG: hypothetical protein DMG07_04785 [Acidobacteriota bacterium]
MRRALVGLLAWLSLAAAPAPGAAERTDFWAGVKRAIEAHLGRPYVWGASGLKSFDCSGFVWRVMTDNGLLVKRTTARKFYMCLPTVPKGERWAFGNVVFFDDLKHCGIVDGPSTFYHAQTSRGTNLSEFDPFWRSRIAGFRRLARPPAAGK